MDRKSGGFVLKSFCSESAAVLGLGFLALFVQPAHAQGPLNYFKNYFVTGDYVAEGVGLYGKAGSAKGTINFSGVPCTSGPGFFASVQPCTQKGAVPADVIAAFLYWQAVETTGTPSYGAGAFDTNPFISVALGNTNVPSCAAGVGTTGPYARVYRADVLRYLPIDKINNVRLANGPHTIQLKGNSANTQFMGATLVVVYRLVTPGNPRIAPLRSVVLYDGAFTGTSSLGLNQTMGGFYQASGDPDAKMTQIVGNGQPISKGERETLTINGGVPQGVPADPFVGAQGANWDNYTFNFNLSPNASSVGTQVSLTNACLSWAAIVTSTNVRDTDFDGLLDVWETSGLTLNPGVRNDDTPVPTLPVPATFGTCPSPSSTNCVNLPAMGANPFVPDIFMQIDWMQSQSAQYSPPHTHNPQLAALNMVGAAFKSHGINLHFDVGVSNTYQNQSSPYIIPAQYAQGGNIVQESSVLCQVSAATPSCNFSPQSGQYSVLGWKTGFDAIKNGDPYFPCPIYPKDPSCNPTPLPQLFATNRKDAFHYGLFGHSLAATSPSSAPNLASISGVADRPGGDLMVTLGLWRSDIAANDQVGSTLQQAGTLMHELGHNLDLSHAGWNTTPNCMPDYPSTMNYLYQTRGLTDSAGNEHIDYSHGLEFPLSEGFLSSAFPVGIFQNYRVRYFGPLNSAINSQGQASLVHCDGTLLSTGAAEGQYVRLEGPSVSTPDWSNGTILPLGKLIETGLDINYNGILGETFSDQPDWISLNLQQVGARPNADGLSLNIGVSDIGVSDIGVSDIGVSDIGVSDIGVSDIGVSDIGVSDIGTANLGQDSLGDEDFATHLLSGVDPPTSLTAVVQSITPAVQVNGNQLNWTPPVTGTVSQYYVYRCNASAAACTPAPPYFAVTPTGTPASAVYVDTPNDFVHAGATCPAKSTCYNTTYTYYVTAVVNVVVANGSMMPSESGSSNTVTSQVPHLFVVANSQAVTYGAANPAPTFTVYGNGPSSAPVTSGLPSPVTCAYNPSPAVNAGRYFDAGNYPIACSGPPTTSATDGVTYVMYNAAYLTYTSGSLTVNPRAITVTAAASSKVYDATISSPATPIITTGSLVAGDSVTWTETYDNKNVGTTHVMTPAGTVNDTNGGKNYTVTPVNVGGGVITQAPLTVTATGVNKVYNSTTAATVTLADNRFSGDVFNDSYTSASFLDPNVGSGKTVNVTGISIGGTDAGNYTFNTTASTTANITPAPLTITAASNTKVYDGGTSAAASPTVSGLQGASDSVTGLAETYASKNAGTGLTLNVSAYMVNDGNGGKNYNVNTVPNTTGVISKATLTIAAATNTKVYDGGTSAAAPPTVSGLQGASDSVAGLAEAYASKNAGIGLTLNVSAYTVNDGNGGNNYTVNAVPNTTGVITQAPASVTPNASGKTYGNPDPVPLTTGTLTGFVDNVSATYSRTAGENVLGSPYTISATLSPAGALGNYNITYKTANFIITPAIGTIGLTNMTQAYTGSPLTPTVTTNASSFSLSGAPDTFAGSYAVTATVNDPNYTPAQASGTFVIELTAAIAAANKPFDGNTTATITSCSLAGVAPPDVGNVTCIASGAMFASASAGSGQTVTANVALAGPAAGSYMLSSLTATTTANISDSIDLASLVRNGPSSVLTGPPPVLQLTNTISQTTSAWLGTELPVASGFSTSFNFQITPPESGANSIGDGFAFVIQADPGGASALGTAGMGAYIGYVGIPNSIAIEFDTYYNSDFGDPAPTNSYPSGSHIGIQSLGTLPNDSHHSNASAKLVNPVLANFADGNSHNATITYDGTTLSVFVDGNFVVSAPVAMSTLLKLDGGTNAYVGFTGATGAAQENSNILGWSWN